MKDEYDFTDAEQGKFYRPLEELDIPIYLDKEVKNFGSLWIPDCFGVRRQSGASESNLDNGDTSGVCRKSGHLRFHPRRGDGAFPWPQRPYLERRCRQIQSGGGLVPLGRHPSYAKRCRFR
ncbi:hypothetical protein [Candidatus Thiosymbion oneisti]|uniref:hypothetical protein n=1 Tax=Candidatus Thiosymbion oneisti TaxID=589554 RepID=UPI001060DF25|nr:hypothetical protein [Candidatus Thiosymbion oneisti]